jgi:hypothetical protein
VLSGWRLLFVEVSVIALLVRPESGNNGLLGWVFALLLGKEGSE